ncbi:MAG: amidohydrolase family protein [Candidatus Dormibacteraceae bacterium]
MIDDIFIFDCVIHVHDLSDANLRGDRPDARYSRDLMLAFGDSVRAPEANSLEYGRRWPQQELYNMVFVEAKTDLAMAQAVPIFDWYQDWFAPVQAQYEMARAHPHQVLFCGGVDPLWHGLDDALDQLDHQVREMGACSIKFYNGHLPRSWRCDDEKVAYPLYERCRELGIKVVQFHKGLPFGMQNVEDLSPIDLQAPARDFPDLEFVIHHLALPYFEEAVSIASRFPNVHLALSGNINYFLIAPRLTQERLGRLLQEVGADKLLWGSEAALQGGPAPYLRAFLEMEIPVDLRSGYGYPQITRDDKEKILGLNFGRLMGIDLQGKRQEQPPPQVA